MGSPVLRVGSIYVSCADSMVTMGRISTSVRGGAVATVVKPSKYKGDALLHTIGHVRRLCGGVHIAKRVLLGNRGILRVRPVRRHHHVNVIFRHPGPFPAVGVCSGILTKCVLGNVRLSGSRGSRVIRHGLHGMYL